MRRSQASPRLTAGGRRCGGDDDRPPFERYLAARDWRDRAAAARRAYRALHTTESERSMLWLIIGVVLVIVAIAGPAIVDPILFVLGILAPVAFLGARRRTAL